MQNKMMRPADHERRDLTAGRVEFRPSLQSQLNAKTPNVGQNSAHLPRKPQLTVGSVDFRSEAMVSQTTRPQEDRPIVEIKTHSHSAEILEQAVKGEYQYGKLGLILGVLTILGGIALGLNGVAGHTSWTAKVLGLESNINDAAPGVVLFVVGIFFVFITKPRVKLGDLKG